MDVFFSALALSPERRYRLGRHFLFWFVCWMFMGFIYGFYYWSEHEYVRFSLSYLEALLYLPQHILLAYGIIYFILPRYIFKGKYWVGIFLVLALILFVAVLSPVVVTFIINPTRVMLSIPTKHVNVIPFSLMAGLRGSSTVAGFAVAIKLVKSWYLKKIDNERLEKEKLAAELEILKGQLHPHFMFNTLNSIYSLALKKSSLTADAILQLSQLLRYILTECNQHIIALEKEVQIMHHYIELEKNRFGNRLDINLNIEGDLKNNYIPPLLLLPLLENSFKHGASEMLDQAWISMDLLVESTVLKFKLINGKNQVDKNSANSSHVGLSNVRRRLELLYPNAHELRITEDGDTFVLALSVQLNNIELPGGER